MAGAVFLKDFVAEAADVEVVANVLDQLKDQLRLVEGHHVCPRLFSEQLCKVKTTENCQMRHETYKMACNDFDLTDMTVSFIINASEDWLSLMTGVWYGYSAYLN